MLGGGVLSGGVLGVAAARMGWRVHRRGDRCGRRASSQQGALAWRFPVPIGGGHAAGGPTGGAARIELGGGSAADIGDGPLVGVETPGSLGRTGGERRRGVPPYGGRSVPTSSCLEETIEFGNVA